jgi:hypothetical protein
MGCAMSVKAQMNGLFLESSKFECLAQSVKPNKNENRAKSERLIRCYPILYNRRNNKIAQHHR